MSDPGRRAALAKYALMQVPGLLLAGVALWFVFQWWVPPLWLIAVAALAWLAKEYFIYTRVRHTLDGSSRPLTGAHGLLGKRAVAAGDLESAGWVRIGSELWKAELAPDCTPVASGTQLRVLAVEGLVLQVGPAHGGQARSDAP